VKADRLLSALLLLQARGRVTGREMAERLEVSGRTVHRDMEALGAAGVPVYALRGSRGGWQLDEDWRTQVPGLDEAELRALLMAQPRVLGDPRLAAAAERALGKLMASLPASMRAQANSIRQRLHVDTTGWRGLTETVDALAVVQEAVARDRKLAFHYRKPDGERSERTVDPLGLVAKGSAWYLVARTSEGFRTFRVSRIEDAVLLATASVRPAGFDLVAHWKSSTDQLRESRRRYVATLRVEPRAAERLAMWRCTAPKEPVSRSPVDGWVTREVEFDDEDQACFAALGFGPRAEVLAPKSLRDRVLSDIAAAFANAPVSGADALNDRPWEPPLVPRGGRARPARPGTESPRPSRSAGRPRRA
jgi:predicted DNA-binding transcriptional regulator YafY